MAVEILGIDHVVLRVADMARALRFYCDVLGCAVERRRDDLGLVHLRAGRSLIDLVAVDSPLGRKGGAPPGVEAHNMDHFALRLARFDAAALAAHLAAHGVAAGEVAERFGAEGSGPSIYVRDPDGNTVELKGPAGAAQDLPKRPV
jgi:catechol 2,3-dioxygenase-like lactoylglutathione lyase family enzyme